MLKGIQYNSVTAIFAKASEISENKEIFSTTSKRLNNTETIIIILFMSIFSNLSNGNDLSMKMN